MSTRGDPAASGTYNLEKRHSQRHHTESSSSSSEDSMDGTASWEVTEMSSETSECCRSRHFFCTSTNQSICQEMGIPDVKICQDGQGVDSGLKCSQNLQIARQKLCFGCRDKQECVSMSHPNLIPSMPWWVYFAVFFTVFSLPVNLCFPMLSIFFSKKFSICKRYSIEISRDFPT